MCIILTKHQLLSRTNCCYRCFALQSRIISLLFALWKRFKSSCISCICLIMFFRGVTLFQFLLEVCFNLDTTCVTDLFINFEIDVSCFTLEMHSIILHRCACWEFIELPYSIVLRFHNTCMRIHVNSFQS